MFKNYFFIPASNIRYIKKSLEIDNIDCRVFDLEDSILSADLEDALELISRIEKKKTDWLRLPLEHSGFKNIDLKDKDVGINNFVIPKFEGFNEIQLIINEILSMNSKAKFILLIENAKSYIDLDKILSKFSECIEGVSLGIHDFSVSTGIKNDYRLLENIRMNISILAKAYMVEAIDIVSIDIKNQNIFIDEVINGFVLGYRSKFLIHPLQLETIKSIGFYTKEEIAEYQEVLDYFHLNIEGKGAVFLFKDKVYEKMHIKEIKKIVLWGNEFYGTARKEL